MLKLDTFRRKINIPTYPVYANKLPRGGQLSIHGNVVNVPVDVNSIANTLPRPINESETIPTKLKRKLSYKVSTIICFRILDQEKCWKQQNTLFKQVNCFKMSI